jgi:hypothetical protein
MERATPSGVVTVSEPGYTAGMDERDKAVKAPKPAEKAAIKEEAREAREGDEPLDDYDKEVADSFPASDPPAMP